MNGLRHGNKSIAQFKARSAKSPLGTHYCVYGDGEDVLVFIHGVGMNQMVWQPQVDFFLKHHQVIVYDLLGHGDSPMPSEQACLSEYSRQLLELIDSLKLKRVMLIGHSTGALISVDFALSHPDRVKALIAMNIVYRREVNQRTDVENRANKVLNDKEITGIETTLARWFSLKTDPQDQEKINRIRQFLKTADPVGYGRTYRMFAQSDDVFVGRLNQLSKPVLYLTGEADPNSTAQMSMQMAQESPYGEALALPDEAHMMAYISAEKINPILDEFILRHREI